MSDTALEGGHGLRPGPESGTRAAAAALRGVLRPLAGLHFWLTVGMVVIGGVLHYAGPFSFYSDSTPIQLPGQTMHRIFFMVPVAYAGFIFGPRGGFLTLLVVTPIMLPMALFNSPNPADALLETASIVLVSSLIILWFAGQQREKERRQEILHRLEVARQELVSQVELIKKNERRLAAINEVCCVVAQSMDLPVLLHLILDKVVEEMGVAAAMIFLREESSERLELVAHKGISEEFATALGDLRVGEGFNGRVAQSGELMEVMDSAQDPRLALSAVLKEGIQSQLIVPLQSKGATIGSLCVAVRTNRSFSPEERELLTALGSQVGIAIENARLFQEALRMREAMNYYVHQVLTAQEEERKRIARELHDETAQSLLLILQMTDSLNRVPAGHVADQREKGAEQLRGVVLQTLADLRRLTRDLRPQILDDLGLVAAVEWLAEEMERQSGIETAVKVVGTHRQLPQETQLLIFRIAQESLSNVRRHSAASQARVLLEFLEGRVRLSIHDNGKGFRMPGSLSELAGAGKLGILGMSERARLMGGSITVRSEPGEGTDVVAELNG